MHCALGKALGINKVNRTSLPCHFWEAFYVSGALGMCERELGMASHVDFALRFFWAVFRSCCLLQ